MEEGYDLEAEAGVSNENDNAADEGQENIRSAAFGLLAYADVEQQRRDAELRRLALIKACEVRVIYTLADISTMAPGRVELRNADQIVAEAETFLAFLKGESK